MHKSLPLISVLTIANAGAALLRRGHVFNGPDGEAFRLTRDVYVGEHVEADQFEAIGGASAEMPDWLIALVGKVGTH